jgi:phage terminase small subunit
MDDQPAAPATPRVPRRGKNATPDAKAARLAALRARSPHTTSVATAAQANPDRPLTAKQKAFVQEWAKGETILSAAQRAGYSDNGSLAYRMAHDPAILKIYQQEKAAYEAAAQMTRKQVMEGFLDGIAMAKLACEPASVIAGWREVGKMCGYFQERKQVDINVTGDVTVRRLEALSDADLLKLVKGEVEDVAFTELGDDD